MTIQVRSIWYNPNRSQNPYRLKSLWDCWHKKKEEKNLKHQSHKVELQGSLEINIF